MASRSWNKVELMGNLTRDPELRFTPSGTAVCTFGLATNRSFTTDKGEKREDVDFHQLVAWGKLGEVCNQILKKGSKVFVSGRIQYREWEGQDGQKRKTTEIVIEDMIQLTPKAAYEGASETVIPARETAAPKSEEPKEAPKEEPTAEEAAPVESATKADETIDDSDLPF